MKSFKNLLSSGIETLRYGPKRKKFLDACTDGNETALLAFLEDEQILQDIKSGKLPEALNEACYKGHEEIVTLLLAHSADINATDDAGNCALLLASSKGHTEIMNALLLHGANVHAINPISGHFALLAAVQNNHIDAATLLLNHKADVNAINPSTNPTDIHFNTPNLIRGFFPLLMAVMRGNEEMVKLLLTHGANVHTTHPITHNSSLLMAAHKGHKGIVNLLLDHGADINAVHPTAKISPLETSIKEGRTETTDLLLQHHAKLSAIMSPDHLHVGLKTAAEKGYLGPILLLLTSATDVSVRENYLNHCGPSISEDQKSHLLSMAKLLHPFRETGVVELLCKSWNADAIHAKYEEVLQSLQGFLPVATQKGFASTYGRFKELMMTFSSKSKKDPAAPGLADLPNELKLDICAHELGVDNSLVDRMARSTPWLKKRLSPNDSTPYQASGQQSQQEAPSQEKQATSSRRIDWQKVHRRFWQEKIVQLGLEEQQGKPGGGPSIK